MTGKVVEMVLEVFAQDLFFDSQRSPPSHQAEAVTQPRARSISSFSQHALADEPCCLKEGDVVHQVQGLQRRIGASVANNTALSQRRIKIGHHRRSNGALPKGV